MIKLKTFFSLAAMAMGTAAVAQTSNYVVDPTHTFVMYEMGHYGTSTNRGRFGTKDGSVALNVAARTGKVDITMDMSSINTGVDQLNRHVQSKDFFNVADFPTSRFFGDKLEFNGDKVTAVIGELTLMGKTHPVTLRALRFNCYQSPMLKRQICGGD
ncbi:MAG: polyisoprenoid-binding protein, partial [Burkholderiales bacterium PBB4]